MVCHLWDWLPHHSLDRVSGEELLGPIQLGLNNSTHSGLGAMQRKQQILWLGAISAFNSIVFDSVPATFGEARRCSGQNG